MHQHFIHTTRLALMSRLHTLSNADLNGFYALPDSNRATVGHVNFSGMRLC